MTIANKYNRARYDIKMADQVNYVKLDTLVKRGQRRHTVRGFYINNASKYGDSATAILDETTAVNLPNHLVDVVREIMADTEATDVINAGKFGFDIIDYQKNDSTYYTVRWVDL